jgi:hypothetical protein
MQWLSRVEFAKIGGIVRDQNEISRVVNSCALIRRTSTLDSGQPPFDLTFAEIKNVLIAITPPIIVGNANYVAY